MQNWLEAEAKMPHVRPDHHADTAADFREQFWISPSLTLPILVPSPMLQTLVRPAERDGKTFCSDHCRQKFLSTPRC